MGEVFVVNASPEITLAKAGHLALLTALAGTIVLPAAVVGDGVSVQFMLKPTISCACKIKSLAFCWVGFPFRINGFMRLVCVPGGGIGPLACAGRGLKDQTVAVPGHRKLQHATQVNPLKVHRRNVAQLIPLDTPRPRVMPRIQDPLDVLGHPRHDDVGQQCQGPGPPTPIYEIQGRTTDLNTLTSPFEGEVVATAGVVTVA
jgi:hypothetical protein